MDQIFALFYVRQIILLVYLRSGFSYWMQNHETHLSQVFYHEHYTNALKTYGLFCVNLLKNFLRFCDYFVIITKHGRIRFANTVEPQNFVTLYVLYNRV